MAVFPCIDLVAATKLTSLGGSVQSGATSGLLLDCTRILCYKPSFDWLPLSCASCPVRDPSSCPLDSLARHDSSMIARVDMVQGVIARLAESLHSGRKFEIPRN